MPNVESRQIFIHWTRIMNTYVMKPDLEYALSTIIPQRSVTFQYFRGENASFSHSLNSFLQRETLGHCTNHLVNMQKQTQIIRNEINSSMLGGGRCPHSFQVVEASRPHYPPPRLPRPCRRPRLRKGHISMMQPRKIAASSQSNGLVICGRLQF